MINKKYLLALIGLIIGIIGLVKFMPVGSMSLMANSGFDSFISAVSNQPSGAFVLLFWIVIILVSTTIIFKEDKK